MTTVGKRLRALREGKDWSQSDLARRAGIASGTVSLIETEGRPNPGADTLTKLASALETTTDYLVGLTDDPDPRPLPDPPDLADPRLRRIIDNWPELSEAMKESFNLQIDAFFAEGQRRR